jgi:hypothetical protein
MDYQNQSGVYNATLMIHEDQHIFGRSTAWYILDKNMVMILMGYIYTIFYHKKNTLWYIVAGMF